MNAFSAADEVWISAYQKLSSLEDNEINDGVPEPQIKTKRSLFDGIQIYYPVNGTKWGLDNQ